MNFYAVCVRDLHLSVILHKIEYILNNLLQFRWKKTQCNGDEE